MTERGEAVRPQSEARSIADMSKVTGIQNCRSPSIRYDASAWHAQPFVIAAGDQSRGEGQAGSRERGKIGDPLGVWSMVLFHIGWSDQKGSGNASCWSLAGPTGDQDGAEAVGNQDRRSPAGCQGILQSRTPGEIGRLFPVALCDPVKRYAVLRQKMFPSGLPVIRCRAVETGNDHDFEAG
ncbi:hypothetical protein GLI01_28200 [Gluconacetobacter liquefaciens]|nr:hypothetical protein GLI01_28200 [Gluconacetobacter liquefaciens]